jgi:hypothetical protein
MIAFGLQNAIKDDPVLKVSIRVKTAMYSHDKTASRSHAKPSIDSHGKTATMLSLPPLEMLASHAGETDRFGMWQKSARKRPLTIGRLSANSCQ